MTQTTRFANLDGSRVAYTVRGDLDPAVVFVHGFAGDGAAWRRQMNGLTIPNRLVALDLIGHGQSDAPHVEYSMDYLARSIAAVLDTLGVAKSILVGWSNGVPVVRQFYRRYPERTIALVAVDGPLRRIMPIEMAERMIAPLRQPNYRETLQRMAAQRPPAADGLPDDEWERIKEVQLNTPQHVLVGTAEAMLPPDVWTEDPIAIPLLVVNAGNSVGPTAWTTEYEQFVRGLAPDIEYHLLEGATHFLAWVRSDEFNALLEAFVTRVAKNAGGSKR